MRRRRHPASRIGDVLFALIIVALPAWVGARSSDASVMVIAEAALLLDASERPPSDDAPWFAQRLPDNWNHSRPDSGGLAWYRAAFILPEAEGSQAIYIDRASMNAAVYINGVLIGSGGSFDEPVARNWNRPNFYLIPPTLLKPGINIVHVRLRVYPRTQGGLSAIEIGPERALGQKYDDAFFYAVSLNQVVSLFTIALGITFFLLWVQRRSDTVYLYFGLGMVLWGMHGLKLFVRTIPVPAYYWDLFTSLIIPAFTVILVPFVLRFVGRRLRVAEVSGVVACVVLIVAHLILGPEYLSRLATIGYATSTLASVPLLYLLASDAMRQPTLYRVLIAFGGAVCVGLAVHDLLWQSGILDFEARPLLQFGGPVLFLGMGAELLSRFARALTVAERANADLEQRVAQKSAALAANYERLSALNREQVMIEERHRIMRDMHDGIGGQLITAITRVRTANLQQAQLETMLVEILDDLRLVIDSMQQSENDLAAALGNFRYRLEPRLKEVGVDLHWRLDNSTDDVVLPPSGVLHILRIMQEAFTNILKHSGATWVSVASSREVVGGGTHVVLRVSDNGCFRPGRAGHGLKNIMSRAQSIGGVAQFGGSNDGSCLMLSLPLPSVLDGSAKVAMNP